MLLNNKNPTYGKNLFLSSWKSDTHQYAKIKNYNLFLMCKGSY
jgi:hypothetical protein